MQHLPIVYEQSVNQQLSQKGKPRCYAVCTRTVTQTGFLDLGPQTGRPERCAGSFTAQWEILYNMHLALQRHGSLRAVHYPSLGNAQPSMNHGP